MYRSLWHNIDVMHYTTQRNLIYVYIKVFNIYSNSQISFLSQELELLNAKVSIDMILNVSSA